MSEIDIVERLQNAYAYDSRPLFKLAAARIEQLEAEKAEQVQWVKDLADMQIKAEARIERLEAALREVETECEALMELPEEKTPNDLTGYSRGSYFTAKRLKEKLSAAMDDK